LGPRGLVNELHRKLRLDFFRQTGRICIEP
jgi:hypothetical protein